MFFSKGENQDSRVGRTDEVVGITKDTFKYYTSRCQLFGSPWQGLLDPTCMRSKNRRLR